MFVETIRSEGLAHLSYVIGSRGKAAIIDPRRDIEAYLEVLARRECALLHVFETHRNEDLVSGAPALAAQTGAPVHHGPNPAAPIRYADSTTQGDRYAIGAVTLKVLETPGHTDDSISLVATDKDADGVPVAVFTGDALFVGDVGRTDFYPERREEVAAQLYESVSERILALGEQTVLLPAHGAGSVCGGGMFDRDFSTLGLEVKTNPRLQMSSREAFVRAKVDEHHYQPPYFREMERLNTEGAAAPPRALATLDPAALEDATAEGAWLLDVRPVGAYLAGHVPGSLSLPVGALSRFAGWFLPYDRDLVLFADGGSQAERARRQLLRMGYDRVRGAYTDSIAPWTASGRAFERIEAVDAAEVAARRREKHEGWALLDVRGAPEWDAGHVPGAVHLYVGHVAQHHEELDRGAAYTVMCGSGVRATIAASSLKRRGFEVDVFLGSMGAWEARGGELTSD